VSLLFLLRGGKKRDAHLLALVGEESRYRVSQSAGGGSRSCRRKISSFGDSIHPLNVKRGEEGRFALVARFVSSVRDCRDLRAEGRESLIKGRCLEEEGYGHLRESLENWSCMRSLRWEERTSYRFEGRGLRSAGGGEGGDQETGLQRVKKGGTAPIL